MSWRDRDVLHRSASSSPAPTAPRSTRPASTNARSSWTLDHRWWSADEIAASKERFEPLDLGLRLKALLRDGPPDEPITLRLAFLAALFFALPALLVLSGNEAISRATPARASSASADGAKACQVSGSRLASSHDDDHWLVRQPCSKNLATARSLQGWQVARAVEADMAAVVGQQRRERSDSMPNHTPLIERAGNPGIVERAPGSGSGTRMPPMNRVGRQRS